MGTSPTKTGTGILGILALGESHGVLFSPLGSPPFGRWSLTATTSATTAQRSQEIEWKHPSSQQVTLNSLMSHKVFEKKAGSDGVVRWCFDCLSCTFLFLTCRTCLTVSRSARSEVTIFATFSLGVEPALRLVMLLNFKTPSKRQPILGWRMVMIEKIPPPWLWWKLLGMILGIEWERFIHSIILLRVNTTLKP